MKPSFISYIIHSVYHSISRCIGEGSFYQGRVVRCVVYRWNLFSSFVPFDTVTRFETEKNNKYFYETNFRKLMLVTSLTVAHFNSQE